MLLTVGKYNPTPDFSVTDLTDMMSHSGRRRAGCKASTGRAGRGDRDCWGTSLRSSQHDVFVRYKAVPGAVQWPWEERALYFGGRGQRGRSAATALPTGLWSRAAPCRFCSAPTDSRRLRVETRDRSSPVRIGKHLVHIYPEKFASDIDFLG